MCPKLRTDGLPSRWQFHRGKYWYRPHPNVQHLWDNKTRYPLGETLSEAYRTYSEKLGAHDQSGTVTSLLQRYALEVITTKRPRTQDTEAPLIPQITKILGHIPLEALEAFHIYQMLDSIPSKSKGNRMVAIMSHACTMGIRWGLLRRHPIKGQVIKHSMPGRKRYVETGELEACLTIAPPLIRAYIPVKLCVGARKSGILRVRNDDITKSYFPLVESKTGEHKVYVMSDTLTEAVANAQRLMPRQTAETLFHNRKGNCYVSDKGTTSGFDSVWQRWMKKCLDQGLIEESFQEHDLRAKTASDVDSEERAQQLLGSGAAVIKKHYRRGKNIVKPHDHKL